MLKFLQLKLFFLCVLLSNHAYANRGLTFTLNKHTENGLVEVTEKDWQDKYLLIAIGYTTCPDICPTTLLEMRDALQVLSEKDHQDEKIQGLFITIDPLTDSAENIQAYAGYFSPRISGLWTDDFDALNAVIKQLRASYGYTYEDSPVEPPNLPDGYTVYHSTYIYLYSPDRTLIDVFSYNMDADVLAEKILQSINE